MYGARLARTEPIPVRKAVDPPRRTGPNSSESFDPQFTVVTKFVSFSFDERNDVLHLKFRILNESDISDKVGHGTGKCRVNRAPRKVRCCVEFHLNGEIGGRGDLVARGNEGAATTPPSTS
jgi:hypothetical protein